MAVLSKHPEMIKLTHESGKIYVITEDEDRFFMAAKDAVKACQQFQETNNKEKQAMATFKNSLLEPLRNWCESRQDRVMACYLPMIKGLHLEVFIVCKSTEFDFDLNTDIAKLERDLSSFGWRIHVMQLPKAEEDNLLTYLTTKDAIEVYANAA